ncbi:hypothetical protein HYQ46_002004 [Verticillium longisporum]|nr:hypothetical protein HYQ46_002004 [Verticillium longisporum]
MNTHDQRTTSMRCVGIAFLLGCHATTQRSIYPRVTLHYTTRSARQASKRTGRFIATPLSRVTIFIQSYRPRRRDVGAWAEYRDEEA